MFVISRFRYDDDLNQRPRTELESCLRQLGGQPGFVAGSVGRALDDAQLWVLQTRWANVGSYRRALSSYDIKMSVVPLLSYAIDEPSAYEVIVGDGVRLDEEPNASVPRSL
ncbi:MAG: antibiotic biosynthesis monooxygenase [Propionibacteriales bacterium]|nr:antibiotic biosynthesis monooxygenase [Propionibacteriales bacterium]